MFYTNGTLIPNTPERVRHQAPEEAFITAVKSVRFGYSAPQELTTLFEDFRLMCNDAIRIALRERTESRFSLIKLAYSRLKEYGLHSHYIMTACEVAYSAISNKKRKSDPYVRRAFLKIDNQSYFLSHLVLRIPRGPREFIFLILQGSGYHLSFIDDPNLKRGGITISAHGVSIAFSKEVPSIETRGQVGLDVNERNGTVSATNGYAKKFNELGEVAETKERYREIRAKIGRMTRQDKRISTKLYAKYGKREINRCAQRIHRVSKEDSLICQSQFIQNNHGEVDGNQEALQKRERAGCFIPWTHEHVAVPRVAATGRIQGGMARRARLLCQPEKDIPKLPGMWLPRDTFAGQETVLSKMRQYLG
jgi:hypothetical protein